MNLTENGSDLNMLFELPESDNMPIINKLDLGTRFKEYNIEENGIYYPTKSENSSSFNWILPGKINVNVPPIRTKITKLGVSNNSNGNYIDDEFTFTNFNNASMVTANENNAMPLLSGYAGYFVAFKIIGNLLIILNRIIENNQVTSGNIPVYFDEVSSVLQYPYYIKYETKQISWQTTPNVMIRYDYNTNDMFYIGNFVNTVDERESMNIGFSSYVSVFDLRYFDFSNYNIPGYPNNLPIIQPFDNTMTLSIPANPVLNNGVIENIDLSNSSLVTYNQNNTNLATNLNINLNSYSSIRNLASNQEITANGTYEIYDDSNNGDLNIISSDSLTPSSQNYNIGSFDVNVPIPNTLETANYESVFTTNGSHIMDFQNYYVNKVNFSVGVPNDTQTKSLTINSNGTQTVTPDQGYIGLSSVSVTTNVDTVNNQSKTVTINSNGTQTVTPDQGYTGLSSVSVRTNVSIPLVEVKNIKLFGYNRTNSSFSSGNTQLTATNISSPTFSVGNGYSYFYVRQNNYYYILYFINNDSSSTISVNLDDYDGKMFKLTVPYLFSKCEIYSSSNIYIAGLSMDNSTNNVKYMKNYILQYLLPKSRFTLDINNITVTN